MKLLYRPTFFLLIDVLVLLISVFIVLMWFPLTTQSPFVKYFPSFSLYTFVWVFCSYIFGRYKPLKSQRYFKTTFKLLYTTLITLGICCGYFVLINYGSQLSEYVLLSVTVISFTIHYFLLFIYFAHRYATEYEIPNYPIVKRKNAHVKPLPDLDEETYNNRCLLVRKHSGDKAFHFLNSKVNLKSANAYVFVSRTTEELMAFPQYRYDSIVLLERLNNQRGINKMLHILNDKLPDDGVFICCFESQSTRKKRFLSSWPQFIRKTVYFFDFIVNRLIPKIFITRRLYYDITEGKNRILSKTEVIGRMYCFGYEVIADKKINHLTYILAKRVKQTDALSKRRYGPLIRLQRYGKNGKKFTVYKFRTMHSYAEYMQEYIYQRNDLQEGGKFKRDIRVTTLGRFMRKYWLDELPMFINLFKGDMKLIGVRPLSVHYFNLYDKELQEKRIKFKPGLLPPFYADMPKNLEDIQTSEMNYLTACEKNGTFVTDCRYFFKIINNILFKKARSA